MTVSEKYAQLSSKCKLLYRQACEFDNLDPNDRVGTLFSTHNPYVPEYLEALLDKEAEGPIITGPIWS